LSFVNDISRYILLSYTRESYLVINLMFDRFSRRFHKPAWAGASNDEPAFQHWFGHGRHHRGKQFLEDMFGFGGEERPRTRRGEIKFLLLEVLSTQPGHGYDLMERMETRSGGFRRPSPGSVYPTLQLLEDEGLVTSEMTAGKRVYTITDAGRQVLAERAERTPADNTWEDFKTKSQELDSLRQAAMDLAGAVMQVARSGRSERIDRVKALLDRTKREIYAMLAEE
jgi:DNA-binding PadR family transcriptional regulator